MMEKLRNLSPTSKGFIVLIILLIIGIIIRWPTIKKEVGRGFGFFGNNNTTTEQVENNNSNSSK